MLSVFRTLDQNKEFMLKLAKLAKCKINHKKNIDWSLFLGCCIRIKTPMRSFHFWIIRGHW